MIPIPESVAFYWGDPVNRAALHVLAAGTEVPADLSLPEVERFELAALAAQRVRVEYWTLLRALWSASWGEAVRENLPTARLLGYGAHRAFAASAVEPLADPSVAYAWESGGQCGVFEVPGRGQLFTGLWLVENATQLQLRFYHLDPDGSCAVSDGLDLGADWNDDGESRRETRAGLLPVVRSEAGIDAAPCTAAARAAVATLVPVLA